MKLKTRLRARKMYIFSINCESSNNNYAPFSYQAVLPVQKAVPVQESQVSVSALSLTGSLSQSIIQLPNQKPVHAILA
jgi:hypothetical protein